VNIPSYSVKPGDEITVKLKEPFAQIIKDNIEFVKGRTVPGWLQVDTKACTGKVVNMPERDDVQFAINEQLIIELYSK